MVFEAVVGRRGSEQHVADGLAVREGVVLREIASARAAPHRTVAGVRFIKASEQFEERRLAGAIGADQSQPLAGAEFERQISEQRPWAEALGQTLHAHQDGHTSASIRGNGWLGEERPRDTLFLLLPQRNRYGKCSRHAFSATTGGVGWVERMRDLHRDPVESQRGHGGGFACARPTLRLQETATAKAVARLTPVLASVWRGPPPDIAVGRRGPEASPYRHRFRDCDTTWRTVRRG